MYYILWTIFLCLLAILDVLLLILYIFFILCAFLNGQICPIVADLPFYRKEMPLWSDEPTQKALDGPNLSSDECLHGSCLVRGLCMYVCMYVCTENISDTMQKSLYFPYTIGFTPPISHIPQVQNHGI
jgi:hypothetical protein